MPELEKRIGKIQKIKFGHGGYQDAMIGFSVDLGGKAWGVSDFKGFWMIDHTEDCKWTEEQRSVHLGRMVMSLNEIMRKARVDDVAKLKDVPVEVTFDGNKLDSWRILEEVL